MGMSLNLSGLQIEYVDPDTLTPAPYNPRSITEDALKRLVSLLDSHGFVDPVIARREDRLLIGGHQRVKANAMRATPDAKIPCVFLEGVSDSRAKALNVALNNQQAAGEFVMSDLTTILQEIDTGEFDVPAFTGFSDTDIAEMMHGMDEFEKIPDGNKPIDEDQMAQTENECPKCGFKW